MTIDYKVSSFLYLHSDFWYNSLGSTCTCHYLIVGTNVSQSASPSKLNFQITGSPTILHWEGHNYFIQSEFEVHEHFMDKLSNRPGLTLISCRQGLQIIKTFYRCFIRVLQHRREHVIHTWDPGPSWSMPQEDGEHLRDAQGRPTPWPPP